MDYVFFFFTYAKNTKHDDYKFTVGGNLNAGKSQGQETW
jgi:hypothetical protein